MGCDIHGFWEAKTPDGSWIAFCRINESRSYTWFGIIADVRINTESQTAARGMPVDSSPAWRRYCSIWGRGLHSHTWLTLDEVDVANKQFSDYCKKSYEKYEEFDREKIPQAEDQVCILIIPFDDTDGAPVKEIPWTGTIADLVGSDEVADKIRMVVAFDN